MEQAISQKVGETLLEAARQVEEQLDTELATLDSLSADDLEALREKRLKQLKLQAKQKQEWKNKGHTTYTELQDQKQWFDTVKASRY